MSPSRVYYFIYVYSVRSVFLTYYSMKLNRRRIWFVYNITKKPHCIISAGRVSIQGTWKLRRRSWLLAAIIALNLANHTALHKPRVDLLEFYLVTLKEAGYDIVPLAHELIEYAESLRCR